MSIETPIGLARLSIDRVLRHGQTTFIMNSVLLCRNSFTTSSRVTFTVSGTNFHE